MIKIMVHKMIIMIGKHDADNGNTVKILVTIIIIMVV